MLEDPEPAEPDQIVIVACGDTGAGKSSVVDSLAEDAPSFTAQPGLLKNLEPARVRTVRLADGRGALIADFPTYATESDHEDSGRSAQVLVAAISGAERALVVVDATRGITPESRRCVTICALLGVRQTIVVANKIDLADAAAYGAISAEIASISDELGHLIEVVPVSALGDVNVTRGSSRLPWHDGPPLRKAISDFAEPANAHCGTTEPADRYSADVIWLGREDLAHGRSYLLKSGTLQVPVVVTSVRHRLDSAGKESPARVLARHDLGRVEIATDIPVLLQRTTRAREHPIFALVDRVNSEVVAVGSARYALRRSANVQSQGFLVDRVSRERLNGHRGRVVWLTGLSGSGKSTIADLAERTLHSQGVRSFVLDGDNVRHGLNKDLGFTAEDRAENVRRVAEVAHLMLDAGLVVLVALVSPFRSDRRAARELFAPEDFLEVFVNTSVEICASRDPKGLYAKAAAGQLPNLSGVGQIYEEPANPDLVVSGAADPGVAADEVVAVVLAQSNG